MTCLLGCAFREFGRTDTKSGCGVDYPELKANYRKRQRAAVEEGCRHFRVERLEVFDAAWTRWDCPTVIVTLDAKRRLSIPVTLAPAKPGDRFDATLEAEEETIILRRVRRCSSCVQPPFKELPSN